MYRKSAVVFLACLFVLFTAALTGCRQSPSAKTSQATGGMQEKTFPIRGKVIEWQMEAVKEPSGG